MDGKDIQKARKAAGLTQKELADKIGVSDTTIYGWENDKWNPNEDREKQLHEVLFDQSESETRHEDDNSSGADTNKCDCNSDAECDDDCCQSGAEQGDESDDQNTAKHSISSNKRRELIKMGYTMGLKHAMLQLKTRAQRQFWDGHTNTAVELRRLHSMLSSRIHDSQSK